MKILEFESISSTNDYVKAHISEGDMIVSAKRQTAGRGSKGRTFDSGMGGLYITKLTCYEHFPASNVFKVMVDSSLAVCHAVEDFSLSPSIKWPNDVYVGGKKICGILIENTFRGDLLANSVVGIGLNINNTLPAELAEIATTMSKECGGELNVDKVKERLIFHLGRQYSVEEYKKYIFFLGKEILLLQNGSARKVKASDIDPLGRLIVEEDGEQKIVTAGEVSLRLL
jgi:BirA family biotin operon repressor/biotin-[acetyl-CoA-carboxylase] ligase